MRLWKYNGRMMQISEIAEESGLTVAQLYARIKRGRTVEEAVQMGKKLPHGKTKQRSPRYIIDDHNGIVCTVSDYSARHNIPYRKVWSLFVNQINAVVESLFECGMLASDITPRGVVRRYAEMVAHHVPLVPTQKAMRYVFDDTDQLVWQSRYARETACATSNAREWLPARVASELAAVMAECPRGEYSAASIAAYCAGRTHD